MDDLINRQDAINSIESHIRTGDELYPITETDKILNHAFEISASCIYNMPSTEPKQKTGKWIHCKYPLGECSVCHKIINIQANEAVYCPCCGSRNTGYEEYE